MDRQNDYPLISDAPFSPGAGVIRSAGRTPQAAEGRATLLPIGRSARGLEPSQARPDPAFEAFATALREELEPEGILEGILADLVVRSAWDLDDEGRLEHPRRRSRPERSLLLALDALERARGRGGRRVEPVRGRSVSVEEAAPLPDRRPLRAPYHVEGLVPEDAEGPRADPIEVRPLDLDAGRWRDRLVFDPDVSDFSPIVRGTWITASYLASLIVDGWSWADILRAHPELVEDDIRACLRFSMEEEESPGVLVPPRSRGESA